MSASGFTRSTPRPAVNVEALQRQREALWSLRDFFLRSRAAGAQTCKRDYTCSDCGVDDELDDPCPHEELFSAADNHGNFTADTLRLEAFRRAPLNAFDADLAIVRDMQHQRIIDGDPNAPTPRGLMSTSAVRR